MKSFCLLILLCSLTAFGQEQLAIPLRTVKESTGKTTMTSLFENGDVMYDPSVAYKGMPQGLTSYIIKTLDFQPEQGVYELYLRFTGKMPLEALKQGLAPYNLRLEDTANLSRTPIKHFVSFLVGKNSTGQTVVIGDANNNYDFCDDELFEFGSQGTKDKLARSRFYFQYSLNGRVVEDSVFLGMLTQSSSIRYVNPIEQDHFLVLSLEEYKAGSLKARETSVNVRLAHSQFPAAGYTESNTRVYFDVHEREQFFEVGDSLQLADINYVINGISDAGDTLYLSPLKDGTLLFGIYPGSYAPVLSGVDLVTNDHFVCENTGGKFLLLDFWGSWCKPCIEAIPDLVKFSRKYRDRLQIVSIAVDRPEQKNSIKQMITTKGMNWIHLYEDIQDTSRTRLSDRYKVETFPTQVLIDPGGKIVYRSGFNSKLTESTLDSLLYLGDNN